MDIVSYLKTEFDDRFGSVKGHDGNRPFDVSAIVTSLLMTGVSLYQAFQVIEDIKPNLREAMPSKEIYLLIYQSLAKNNRAIADSYRRRVVDEISVTYPNGERKTLTFTQVRKEIRDYWQKLGFVYCTNLANEFSDNIVAGIRNSFELNITEQQLWQLIEDEHKRCLGRTLPEMRDDIPINAAALRDELGTDCNGYTVDMLVNRTLVLSSMLLVAYNHIPGINPKTTLSKAKNLCNNNLRKEADPIDKKLLTDLRNYEALCRRHNRSYFDAKAVLLKSAKLFKSVEAHVFIKPGPISDKDTNCYYGLFLYMAGFLAGSWHLPSEQRLMDIEEQLLINLFRYGCIEFFNLTRDLQVHPKQMVLVLASLERKGLIIMHRLVDRMLIILSNSGEKYCSEKLGLKIKYKMPHM